MDDLIQQLPAAVYICDNKGAITYYNKAAELLWGQKPEIGTSKWDSFWKSYNCSNSSSTEEKPIHKTIRTGEAINSQETVAVRQDGKKYFLLSSTQALFDKEGKRTGVLDMLIDNTDQKNKQLAFQKGIVKNNEEILRQKELVETILNSSVDAIAVFDKNTRFIALNRKCEELYSINYQEVIGKKYAEVFPNGAESSNSYEDLKKGISGEQVHTIINTSDTLDGSFEVFTVPLIHNSEIYAVLSVVHDITTFMKVSERLQITNKVLEEKNKELERSNNELASFSYIASHDLQEPLRKIITFADKLLEIPELKISESTKTYIEKIIVSSERMRQLIEDVLNFSRISAEEKFTPTDLNQVVNHVLADFDHHISEKNATVHISELPIIPAVELQMKQLFHNLFGNALKFSNKLVSPVIQVCSEPLTSKEIDKFPQLNKAISYVKIIVSDNGIGFNPEFAEKIFLIFQRLHGNSEFTGTGIGLALCRKITDNHNGIIYAESTPGKGSSFHIILPSKISAF